MTVVSEAFAHSFWPGENPVGKVILESDGPSLTVVGVVRDNTIKNSADAVYRGTPAGRPGRMHELVSGFQDPAVSLYETAEPEEFLWEET